MTYSKQQKLLKTASHYLQSKKMNNMHPIRFDVLGVEGVEPRIEWIKNAFGMDF